MNPYVNINRIEFPVTYACTGKCRHCSAANMDRRAHMDAETAARTVREVAARYAVSSVMTFGGEPLLYPETVRAIHTAAYQAGVPNRQIITNGCFSDDDLRIVDMAEMLTDAKVNDILISVDAFHAEGLNMEKTYLFAETLAKLDIARVRLSPAWLVSREDDNPWNQKTRALLARFGALRIPEGEGNVVFAAGNAVQYLSEYLTDAPWSLTDPCGTQPYSAAPDFVDTLCVDPDGNIMICGFVIGNIFHRSAVQWLDQYDPYARGDTRALLSGGVPALLAYAKARGITVDSAKYKSACGVCVDVARRLREAGVALA